jgi:3-hydroxyacyl-[acyl-carrier-protein] dehydratase
MGESDAKLKLEMAEPTDILRLIPHRYPLLLVDRIVDMEGDRSATGIKNVTANESYFQGHLPRNPVMPPMLLIEGMAQTAGALCMHHLAVKQPRLIYFMAIDNARLRRAVAPGDTIHYYVEKIRSRRGVWRYRGRAIVNGTFAAQAEFTAVIVKTESRE